MPDTDPKKTTDDADTGDNAPVGGDKPDTKTDVPNTSDNLTMTKEDLNELLNKVRGDEKRLRYTAIDQYTAKITETEKEKAELVARIAELENAAPSAAAKDDDPTIEASTPKSDTPKKTQKTDTPSTTTEPQTIDIEAIKAELATNMKVQIEAVRDEAALQIHLAKLDTYKAESISKSGLDDIFVDMVQGDTKEEIDASVVNATQKQTQAEERWASKRREELGDLVPSGGFNPGTTQPEFGDEIGNFNPQDRQRLARIRDNGDFLAIKDKLLKGAEQLVRGQTRRKQR